MQKELKAKYNKLKNYLSTLDEIVIAYSGGVDSTLLLKVARDIELLRVYAIIGKTSSTPADEFTSALTTARQIGIEPVVLETEEMNSPEFCSNSLDRCYHCKKSIFKTFQNYIDSLGMKNLADGSNYDDLSDFRPGTRALEEYGVISPFKENGFTKNDIRELSKELMLPTWNKEAMACLATRIAYGEPINTKKLEMIEEAENYLRKMGFTSVRARIQGQQLRIESSADQLYKFFEEDVRQQVIQKMKEIGFKFITIDMEGYRMGSMN